MHVIFPWFTPMCLLGFLRRGAVKEQNLQSNLEDAPCLLVKWSFKVASFVAVKLHCSHLQLLQLGYLNNRIALQI